MTHGWSTKKIKAGFEAQVYRFDGEHVVLKRGVFAIRSRAESFAKKWVLFYRRGGK